jgi:hypothetical protein
MDLMKLHTDVAFGRSNGKIIWQPRIDCWYFDKLFAGEKLPGDYDGLSRAEIYRKLGVSARFYNHWNKCFKYIESEKVIITEKKLNGTDVQITIETPIGRQVAVNRQTPNSPRVIRLKWVIESKEEMKVAIWRVENARWQWRQEVYEKEFRELSEFGAPTMYLPRVNIQDLYINKMGVEKTIYALYDWQDLIEKYFKVLNECYSRLIDIVNQSPINIINFADNLHCGTLPPNLFEKYILPFYQEQSEKLHNAGKFVSSHWDGDTKALLPYAKETGLDGIEAITPKPQGDVTLEEIKEALGDDVFLLDGLPAIFFDEEYPIEMLKDYTHKLIEYFAPKLILGISDELSSTGDIERINIVSEIVDKYNSSL